MGLRFAPAALLAAALPALAANEALVTAAGDHMCIPNFIEERLGHGGHWLTSFAAESPAMRPSVVAVRRPPPV